MSTEGQIPDDRGAAPENVPVPAATTDDPRTDDAGADGGFATDDAPTRLDPELSVARDTIDLSEPDLAPAEITPEVADAASLDAAAAEARAVAAQAEEASSLVGGPMPRNAPVARASRDGTAPAGAVVEDGPGTSPTPGESSDGSAYQGDHDAPTGRPIAAGERSGDRPDEEERATRDEPRTRSIALPLLLVIGAVVVLVGLLIWLVASLVSGLGPADAAPQDHPAPVSVLVHA
ncbi:hypothetical protein FQ377_02050 [Arthrobacter echini]|uniref:Uncharacterized protein n=1 Tax=Arthrobacter echini TaxID=1529066 RepID=A0A5D0XTT5_9MICC|nr:hypothetical protein [Arthrobacter echini]TYD00265.1 hypothetical protein FQ377_02050 [Arthrobacter echini]